MKKIEVKMVKSPIGYPCTVKKTLWGLGLRKMNSVRVHKDNNCIRGMINKVRNFVSFRHV